MLNDELTSQTREQRSLVDLFLKFAGSRSEFLQYDNGYRSWRYTYAQVGGAALNFAARLRSEGIGKGDKVIFWSENRPEWIAAFWGCVLDGIVVVPIDYRASPVLLRRVQEIVDARLILIGEEVQLPAWERQPPVWRLSDLEWTAASREAPSASINKDDIAEIVFTSGSTGEPKGVLITHGNILANLVSPERVVSKYGKWFRPVLPLRFLSLIPLSHMFGQALSMFILPLIPGVAVFMRGYSPQEIVRQIRSRRVSVVAAVPKILEVLREDILRRFPEAARPPLAGAHWVLRWWQYRRIHSFFGWKFWAFIVGAAPLAKEVEEFWSRLGFAVIQGYGLTETAPIVSFNNPFGIKKGTVGKPVAGMEVKIAPDGEILVRGELVMHGYWRNPAETARVLVPDEDQPDAAPWLHTGDIGHIDDKGRILITDRKKDMIVNDKGDNISPQKIEGMLTLQPEIAQAMIAGDRRPYTVALIVPDAEWALGWAQAQDEKFDMKALQQLPSFRAAIRAAIDRVNDEVAVIEKVRQFIFADAAFAIANEEMTTSLKIRRHKLQERYGARLDALYKG